MDTSVVHNVAGNIYNMYVHFADFETIYNKFITIAGLSYKSSVWISTPSFFVNTLFVRVKFDDSYCFSKHIWSLPQITS